jgi:hypothetical protein
MNAIEELDGTAVSALIVRSRKLSNARKGQTSDRWPKLLSRAPPCFRRHVELLVPAAFAVVSTYSSFKESWRQAPPVVKIIAESLSQHDEKHVVPAPFTGIKVGKKEIRHYCMVCYIFCLTYTFLWPYVTTGLISLALWQLYIGRTNLGGGNDRFLSSLELYGNYKVD